MARKTKRGGKFQSEREKTQPAEEWGERVATGRAIARGGGNSGAVPGATEQTPMRSDVVTPPAPPGESSPLAVQKTQAVADALARLGDQADPQRVVETVKAQTGLDLGLGEAAEIQRTLRKNAQPPIPSKPGEDSKARASRSDQGASRDS